MIEGIAVARADDDATALRFALNRQQQEIDRATQSAASAQKAIDEHMIRCELIAKKTNDDLAELRWIVILASKIILPMLAVVLCVQILGLERTLNITDTIKGIRTNLPLTLPEK